MESERSAPGTLESEQLQDWDMSQEQLEQSTEALIDRLQREFERHLLQPPQSATGEAQQREVPPERVRPRAARMHLLLLSPWLWCSW